MRAGGDKPEISVSKRKSRVMSNVLESGLDLSGGNRRFFCSSVRIPLAKRSSRVELFKWRLAAKLVGGCLPSKTFLRAVVPPSTRSLLNLTPFVVSEEAAKGEGDLAAAIKV